MFDNDIDPSELLSLSQTLQQASTELEKISRKLRKQTQSNPNKTVAACAEIAQAVASGVLEIDALLLAQRNYPTVDVFAAWKARKHAKAAQDKLGRLHIVREMTKSGYTDAQIASVINCHPNHVYRLRKEAIKTPFLS